MHVAIVGAGLAGIATAFELIKQGHEVSVMEQGASVAAGASFAPTGLFCPPWTGIHGLLEPLPATRWWSSLSGAARRAHAAVKAGGAQRASELAHAGLTQLQRHMDQTPGLALPAARPLLVLARSAAEERRIKAAWLDPKPTTDSAAEPTAVWLDAAALRECEPALGAATSAVAGPAVRGALCVEAGGSYEARALAHAFKDEARLAGAQFSFDGRVERLRPLASGGWEVTAQDQPPLHADAVVVCTDSPPAMLLRELGVAAVPLRHLAGMSLTLPLTWQEGDSDHPIPRSVLLDAASHTLITPLAGRVRAASPLRFVREPLPSQAVADKDRTAPMFEALEYWLPGCARVQRPQVWQASVSVTPDHLPLVGPAFTAGGKGRATHALPGLWLNLAHGAWGVATVWAAAASLARQLAGAPCPHAQMLSAARF